jgi:hypothetical protein
VEAQDESAYGESARGRGRWGGVDGLVEKPPPPEFLVARATEAALDSQKFEVIVTWFQDLSFFAYSLVS